jgi:hypothetical protein
MEFKNENANNTKYSLRSWILHSKFWGYLFYTNPDFTDLKLVKTLPFSSSTCRIQCIFCMVWAGWRHYPLKQSTRHNTHWNVFESLLTFVNFVTCKRSITFELSVKGILNKPMSRPVFPVKCFQFVDIFLMKHLQFFDTPIH